MRRRDAGGACAAVGWNWFRATRHSQPVPIVWLSGGRAYQAAAPLPTNGPLGFVIGSTRVVG